MVIKKNADSSGTNRPDGRLILNHAPRGLFHFRQSHVSLLLYKFINSFVKISEIPLPVFADDSSSGYTGDAASFLYRYDLYIHLKTDADQLDASDEQDRNNERRITRHRIAIDEFAHGHTDTV